MSDIGIKKIEILPYAPGDSYEVYISYEDNGSLGVKGYSVSVHKAVEYCLSVTKNFNSLYISALERALQLFNWDVLAEDERKGIDDGD